MVTVERLREQVSEKALHLFSRIIVLGGRAYVDRVRLAFGGQNVQILDPIEGKPIGKRLHWLKNPESPCGPEPPQQRAARVHAYGSVTLAETGSRARPP